MVDSLQCAYLAVFILPGRETLLQGLLVEFIAERSFPRYELSFLISDVCPQVDYFLRMLFLLGLLEVFINIEVV